MFSCGLRQVNTFINVNGNLLDLVFTNLPEYLDLTTPSSPLLPVDIHHSPFILLLDEENHTIVSIDDQNNRPKPDYSACNFDLLNLIFGNKDWDLQRNNATVDQMLKNLYDSLFEVIDRHVPKKRQAFTTVFNKPWWTTELRNLRNTLRKFRSRYFLSKSDTDRDRLRELEAEYKIVLSSTYDSYLFNVQATVKQNPSFFWDFIKQRKSNNRIPSSVKFEGSISNSNTEAANLFATFFESVFSKASPVQRNNCFAQIPSYNINLPCVQFSPEEVQKGLEDLDESKGAGTDDLPPAFLKNCAGTLAAPIAEIFNRSLRDRIFPAEWKVAAIVPIHKSGSHNCVTNYRGVSILCSLSKVFEKLVHPVVYSAVAPFISNSQHGFMKKRSTTSNLMCYVSAVSRAIESKKQVDSIYVDFAKAFDTVPHNLIIDKMRQLGFPAWFTEWLYSYLSNRSAFVKVNSTRSNMFDIPSGVPQGSVLGPLVFIIYINDLYDLLSSFKVSFADDLKFFRIVASLVDCVALQRDIDVLLVWCGDNGMRVNGKKCKVISYTRCNSVIQHQYYMGPDQLERVDSICDLGVTMDSKLRFNEHISIIAARAFTVLGFIRRHTYDFTDVYCLKTLFCSLARSILEYASPVWSPNYLTHILTIERVQRKFLRFALRQLPWNDPDNLPSYPDRCKLINLELLSTRRAKLQRLFIFDLITGNIDCPELLELIPWNTPSRQLRTAPLFYIPFHRTNYGFNNAFNLCLRLFNGVQNEFDFNLSKRVFKSRIRDIE